MTRVVDITQSNGSKKLAREIRGLAFLINVRLTWSGIAVQSHLDPIHVLSRQVYCHAGIPLRNNTIFKIGVTPHNPGCRETVQLSLKIVFIVKSCIYHVFLKMQINYKIRLTSWKINFFYWNVSIISTGCLKICQQDLRVDAKA